MSSRAGEFRLSFGGPAKGADYSSAEAGAVGSMPRRLGALVNTCPLSPVSWAGGALSEAKTRFISPRLFFCLSLQPACN